MSATVFIGNKFVDGFRLFSKSRSLVTKLHLVTRLSLKLRFPLRPGSKVKVLPQKHSRKVVPPFQGLSLFPETKALPWAGLFAGLWPSTAR